jgi:glucose/arabinose dehydrogenase
MTSKSKIFRLTDRRTATAVLLAVACAITLIACASGSAKESEGPSATAAAATVKTYVGSVNQGVGLAIDNKGRLLYAEKDTGRIIRVASGKKTALAKLAVAGGGEPGLLGLAADDKGNVWAYYTSSRAGCPKPTSGSSSGSINAHCIWKFKPSGDKLKADRLVFSSGHPADAANHVGGGLHLGPDGQLYLGLGDLGENDDPNKGPGRAQSLDVPFGKILRLNPDATNKGATGNPTTCGNADNSAKRTITDRRIWACGLRNPYSFDWDTKGRLWVAEVGDGCDELDIVRAGVNYGWQPPRTDCSGAGQGKPIRKVTGTPSGVAVPKSKTAGSWRGQIFYCIFASGSLKRLDTSEGKTSTVGQASGKCGYDLLASGRYVYMSNGSQISRLRLPG